MFFEDEKDNLENLDNLEEIDLDLGDDVDDESIDWDELLKDDEEELVSVATDKPKPVVAKKAATVAEDIVEEPTFDDLTETTPIEEVAQKQAVKDAFDMFGGSEENEQIQTPLQEEAQPEIDAAEDSKVDAEEYEEDEEDSQTTQSKLPILLGVLLALAIIFAIYMHFGNKPKQNEFTFPSNPSAPIENATEVEDAEMPLPEGEEPLKDENGEDIPVVDDEQAKTLKPEKKITVSVDSVGRVNPFLPTSSEFSKNIYSGIPAQTLLPPDAYGNDISAQDLMKVSVSGILFDNNNSSAIITINEVDYFVQKGDIVDDYQVLDINRQAVVVKKGSNIYKAGVGEMLNRNFKLSGGSVTMENGARRYTTVTDDEVEVKAKSDFDYDNGYSDVRIRTR